MVSWRRQGCWCWPREETWSRWWARRIRVGKSAGGRDEGDTDWLCLWVLGGAHVDKIVGHSDKVCFVIGLFLIVLHPWMVRVLVGMLDAHNNFKEVWHLLRWLQSLLKARRFLDEQQLDLLETLPWNWCSVPKCLQGKCGSQVTQPCFSLAKDCYTLEYSWCYPRGQSWVQACY